MPTTVNKQRLVTQIFAAMSKSVKQAEPQTRPILDEFVYAILREGSSRDNADEAFERLRKSFYDWNEIRVSAPQEICEVLEPLLDKPMQRAQRIIDFLQEVFETTFSFDLEAIEKKGMKQAAKTLSRYQAANDYAVAWVTQARLGGHAIPLDSPSLRTLRRLHLIEEDEHNLESIRASLEHQIPKAKGVQFVDSISSLALEMCGESDPTCPKCPLKTSCPTGADYKRPPATKKPR
jgi:endonuclease-3